MFGTLGNRTVVKRPVNQSSGFYRLQKDLNDLDTFPDTVIDWPDKKNLMEFTVTVNPKNGYWAGGSFPFSFKILPDYPIKAPEVLCLRKIFHPNIDLNGKVCLNILREDYRPVLTISSIIHGLRILFTEPNPTDPLNTNAAQCMVRSQSEFANSVRRAMQGDYVGNERYDRVLIR
ncbi:hypothetical protein RCL1_004704 [Eukaryota sp. TZLM3-RCL]